ncbi:MAG: MFS transporter [Bacillota bacterium]
MAKKGLHYGWIVLAAGTLGIFGALGLARFGYSTVLPAMQKDLGLSNGQAGLLAAFNLSGYLALSVSAGILAARFGARATASMGLALAGAGMVCTGLAHGFLPLAAWRGLTGMGSGAANIAVMGLWAAWFSAEKRGLASGIAVSGSSLALILAGLMTPWAISFYGDGAWRGCWFAFGIITCFLAACSWIFLRNNPQTVGLKPVGGESGNGGAPAEPRKPQWSRVYRSPVVWRLGMVYIAFGFSYIIYMTFFVKRLVADEGYSAAAAGRLFMTMGWFSMLSGLFWGMVSDKIGRKKTLIMIYLIQALAFGLFALHQGPFAFALSAVLFGLSAWSVPATMAAICGDMLGAELAPAALGFVTLFFGIGQVAGPAVAGAMADAAGSFSPAFWLAAAGALAGAGGSLSLPAASGRH